MVVCKFGMRSIIGTSLYSYSPSADQLTVCRETGEPSHPRVVTSVASTIPLVTFESVSAVKIAGRKCSVSPRSSSMAPTACCSSPRESLAVHPQTIVITDFTGSPCSLLVFSVSRQRESWIWRSNGSTCMGTVLDNKDSTWRELKQPERSSRRAMGKRKPSLLLSVLFWSFEDAYLLTGHLPYPQSLAR